MQNLLTSAQLKMADVFTIQKQSISSVELMERAALAFVETFSEAFFERKNHIAILCGQGNNGGDGLAIARLLTQGGYMRVKVYLINFSTKQSEDYTKNLERLTKRKINPIPISKAEELNELKADIVIDAVLGSGLNQPLAGEYAALADIINRLSQKVISVDVPTGMPPEGELPEVYNGIKADLVICFQQPKLNFFFPESVKALTKFKVVDIGLDEGFIANQQSDWKLTTESDIQNRIKPRANFSHKGTYGHALLVAGNYTTMGAALLAASACLHVGAGLTTVCLPQSGLIALNTALPEVMALPRNEQLAIEAFEKFNAIAIGPGMGLEEENEMLLARLIELKKPLIVDADALTILSKRKELFDALPPQSILTPHVKEFDRLFGLHQNWWQRIKTAQKEAKQRSLVIILKNQYTFICLPNGEVHVNPTGNPAMASGGMGDVLTGLIVGLAAQSYTAANAAILAVYLHGQAGDELAKTRFTVNASALALQIPKTIQKILD
ncbi:bifunctional ADP-dependent NAD(P)H-hydrate dehydratase/NAD(P)H-hydrate epimerase [Pedobacter sp. Hv1]|uniref:bifunctional ADP-dependent NAD(P)H-hydrate dehydratase/NAD(P)H-hydrate epimerase n=1 Tax=Pedobacter sp. Hv1 TaxID=1740090 RepID=UPI0006D8BF6F|nr:bifunctional ADP-dependent NAD(P)H-hydrate dehydratase/NAD(P)H-hydrate epimerase [Pedobacter sp. Hv1]KQB99737.1 carbohydrate kinase [Pedobacter sp. Hv1]